MQSLIYQHVINCRFMISCTLHHSFFCYVSFKFSTHISSTNSANISQLWFILLPNKSMYPLISPIAITLSPACSHTIFFNIAYFSLFSLTAVSSSTVMYSTTRITLLPILLSYWARLEQLQYLVCSISYRQKTAESEVEGGVRGRVCRDGRVASSGEQNRSVTKHGYS